MTNDNPDALTMAKGYLQYYEAFNNEAILLDSVQFYLNKVKNKDDLYRKALIHLNYLKGNFKQIVDLSTQFDSQRIDMWTAYRIGEAYLSAGKYPSAVNYFSTAVSLQPLNLDYNFKLATAQLFSGDINAAEEKYLFIISENPTYYLAWNNLGVIQMNSGRLKEAEQSFLKCIRLDPDYINARIKLAELYLNTRQKTKATELIDYLKEMYPDDATVNQLLLKLRSI